MKMKFTQKAFTLIELLVVITIMGILATGATTVYTSQIQKARDSTRLTDIKALQAGVEQYYQDNGEYPDDSNFAGVIVYVPKLPSDPKTGQVSGTSVFEYLYNVSIDANTIHNQEYEISTHFEQSGNLVGKAATDGGDDDNRMEIGINVDDAEQLTAMAADPAVVTVASLECINNAGVATTCGADAPLVIKGNP